MTAVEALLKVITEPTIAYLLLSLGSLGLFLELSNPGSILPGVAGVICLLLGLYALGSLPVTYAGALFLALAFALFIADVLAPTHGILTVGGIISFALGSMLLINAPQGAPWLEISISAIIGATAALGGFFLFVAGSLARLRGKKPVTGREGLIGQVGEVRTPLDPKGTVFVTGELWSAVSDDGRVAVGQRVEVVGLSGLTLSVRSLDAPPTDVKGTAEQLPPTPA
jgi:membrane-bound serine protease (ClpP class)